MVTYLGGPLVQHDRAGEIPGLLERFVEGSEIEIEIEMAHLKTEISTTLFELSGR